MSEKKVLPGVDRVDFFHLFDDSVFIYHWSLLSAGLSICLTVLCQGLIGLIFFLHIFYDSVLDTTGLNCLHANQST